MLSLLLVNKLKLTDLTLYAVTLIIVEELRRKLFAADKKKILTIHRGQMAYKHVPTKRYLDKKANYIAKYAEA